MRDGTWGKLDYKSPWTVYPRLEFVIGELDKLDKCFEKVPFNSQVIRQKYFRGSSISSLRNFANISPNKCHYWMANYLKAGSIVVTANFDTGIENAMKVDTSDVEIVDGIQNVHGVYHYHGVATDKDIAFNLGATIKNISKGFPYEFKKKLEECFEAGWDVVFLGYGGVDYFDAMPFFKELKDRNYPGRAIYVKHCWDKDSIDRALSEPKYYRYLLDPFENCYVIYGRTIDFLEAASTFKHSQIQLSSDNEVHSSVVKELNKITANNDEETYHFINLLRFCSQLTISPAHFEKNYVQKIGYILDEWEKDGDFDEKIKTADMFSFDIAHSGWKSKKLKKSGVKSRLDMELKIGSNELSSYLGWTSKPATDDLIEAYVDRTCDILDKHEDDKELIEQNTVFYFCGYRLKKDMFRWILDRKRMRKRFMKYKPHIDRMQSFSPTVFTYRTFYLSLCRTKNAYEAMLDDRPGKMTYGDLDFEWFTCMQIPDLLDAERIVRDLLFQCGIRILRFRSIKIRKVIELLMIWKKLDWIKTDPR